MTDGHKRRFTRMLKFGEFICKHKKIILIVSLLLLIPSILGMKATRVNYDILVYLPDDIETVKGEKILSDEFNMGSFSIVMVDNMKMKDIIKLEDKMRQVGNVQKVVGLADVIRN
jgi:predicted RND superfamily exporter protein